MLDPKYIREHADEVKKNCKRRNSTVDFDKFLALDADRGELLRDVEAVRAERNSVAAKVSQLTDGDEKTKAMAGGKELKEKIASGEKSLGAIEAEWRELLMAIPNLTHKDAPLGKNDEDNAELKKVGDIAAIEHPQDHVELAKAHDLIDFERGVKVAGAKFYFLKGKLAILDQALIRYAIDFWVREGFEMLTTPDVAKEEVLTAKGFLPRGPEKQVYYIEGNDLALVGTAEIPILGYHMGETLAAESLPKKYVAFSHCFRTEAGAYGRESYGLYRVHQFSKVEMFAFALPEQSEALHLEFLRLEEAFWASLQIPYRVVDCAAGDLGGSDYRRFDIEAWMWGRGEGKGAYGEVTSASNCIDFQARGADIKFASKNGEKGYVHTLNGTCVATSRAMIAILENNQQPDGSILIPEVLVPYCGFDKIG
ncbi:serine--tRNA ligase [Patescibacteria group bacterium]|nr:serine--tRNA ligase [Patescibacteria group bacterium]MBU1629974.1 serine--tRNA ligase [Patescibacteria group bacterium]